jgi:hypothetical protein
MHGSFAAHATSLQQLAINCSKQFLESRDSAKANIIEVLSLWQEHKPQWELEYHVPAWLLIISADPTVLIHDEQTAAWFLAFGPSVTHYLRLCLDRHHLDKIMFAAIVQFHR